jgi:8-amino-7-oxononanoate synthase
LRESKKRLDMNTEPSSLSDRDGDGNTGTKPSSETKRIHSRLAKPLPASPPGASSGNGFPPKMLLDKVWKFEGSNQVRSLGIYPYFRRIQSCQNPEVTIEGRTFIMLGSNNYLGLVSDARVIEAARAAALRYGTGCAGSRLLNGTLDIHEELEARLAAFVKKDAAILYSTGFQSNLGAIATLATRSDQIVLDRRNHASIVDGAQLSRAGCHRYRHNDMEHLEQVLASMDQRKGILLVVDGVFSMEGDVAELPTMVNLTKRYGAVLLVDDAHGLGVLGERGRGTCAHFGVTDDVEIIMGTFSKSLASIGGFIASDARTIDFLRHHSRPFIFSASMPPASVASVLKALDIIDEEPQRIAQLWRNADFLRRGLHSLGLDTGKSTTPIIPVIVKEDHLAFRMCMMLHQEGVFVNPVPGLSLEPGTALIRLSVMATHEERHIAAALEKIEKVGRALGLVNRGA